MLLTLGVVYSIWYFIACVSLITLDTNYLHMHASTLSRVFLKNEVTAFGTSNIKWVSWTTQVKIRIGSEIEAIKILWLILIKRNFDN